MKTIIEAIKAQNKNFIHIVFVCTANCCRSPLAEILFEKMLVEKLGSMDALGKKKLFIDSAATNISGLKISENSMKVLIQEEAVSPERCMAHQGKRLDEIDDADLVLVMAEEHLKRIQANFPQFASISYRLDDFVKADSGITGDDISDPIGGSYEAYQIMKNIVKNDLQLLQKEMEDVGII
ncbi:MAG: hypothetical protein JXR70_11210 [Spirochaetales bacterium]|nr:hypothetical protein [Spirochaetales bacterium]